VTPDEPAAEPPERATDGDDESSTAPPARLERLRSQVSHAAEAAHAELERRRPRSAPVDVAVRLYERDRDAFASVLGSAIAMRLFVFWVSLMVAAVALVELFVGTAGLHSVFDTAGVTGSVATQLEGSASGSAGRSLVLLFTGLFLTLSSGRSLTRVLTACSAGAWGLSGRDVKARVRTIMRITGLVALLVVAAGLLNRVRGIGGVALATSSLAVNVAVLGVGWFLVVLSLPRRTPDPGAVLPGAALFGVAATFLQWFMHYWFPRRIANASRVMGTAGITVAALGYMFLIGRLMAASLVVNAVLWERFGSVSEFVFGLPLVRRLPRRFPRLAAMFDLDREPPAPAPQQ